MDIKKIEKAFKDKPYLNRMGAKAISERFNLDEKSIIEFRKVKKLIKKNNSVRILILDIETSPMMAYVWSRWKQNIYLDQTISE